MNWIDKAIKSPTTGLEEMFVMDAVITKAQYIVENKAGILKEDADNKAKGKRPIVSVVGWVATAERLLKESKEV